jgi:DNA-binding XRE family transcriptional regulator
MQPKISFQDAEEIRALAQDGFSLTELAEVYGITPNYAWLISKGRARMKPPDGEKREPLTLANGQAIRERYATGTISQADLAQEWGVSQSFIYAIVKGKALKGSSGPSARSLNKTPRTQYLQDDRSLMMG